MLLDYSYQVVQEDDSQMTCLVRKPIAKFATSATPCPIPRYSRTRQVIFREVLVDGKPRVVVTCSCDYFTRKHGPCRHFYGTVKRGPRVDDFAPDCFKSYELYYGTNDAFTKRCDVSTNAINAHGGLILDTSLKELKSTLRDERVDLSWYKAAWSPLGIQTNPHCVREKLSNSNGPNASGINPAPFGFTYSSNGANVLEQMAGGMFPNFYYTTSNMIYCIHRSNCLNVERPRQASASLTTKQK